MDRRLDVGVWDGRSSGWRVSRAVHLDGYGPPVTTRWFEDYAEGSEWEFGPLLVDEAEVIDFGRRFDPQPFHVDPAAAATGPYGGLIASGWHTCALMMRLLAWTAASTWVCGTGAAVGGG